MSHDHDVLYFYKISLSADADAAAAVSRALQKPLLHSCVSHDARQ